MLRATAAALLCSGLFLSAPALAHPTGWSVAPGAASRGSASARIWPEAWSVSTYGYGNILRRDQGYFAQSGEAPRVANGHARYDYDRGYPYDHYYGYNAQADEVETGYGADAGPECAAEWTRDRRSRRDVEVIVCRN